jgi:ABC-type branched-subunit amino acid transport system ATPase component
VLLVDHDMHLVSSVCDRIVVLHQGQILTEGKPSQVLSDPRVAEVYLGTGAKP